MAFRKRVVEAVKDQFRSTLACMLLVTLAGCQSPVINDPTSSGSAAGTTPATAPQMPFPEPTGAPQELNPDVVFSYLVGEIGAHRGELLLSYSHYLHAAILAHDPYAAERATRIAMHLQDQPAALRAARRWVELAPNSLPARQSVALLLLRDGQADESLEQVNALLLIAEASGADGYSIVGQMLSKEADKVASLAMVRRLVDAAPDDARPLFAQSLIQVSASRNSDAEATLRRAIALRPDWPQPRILLARVLLSLERGPDAIAETERAIALLPDDVTLRTTLARLYVDAERYDEAIGHFKTLREQRPRDPDILYAVGMLGLQTSDFDAARSAFQKLRGQRDRYSEATYFLAQTEEAAGDTQAAMGLYATVTEGRLRTDAAIKLAQLKAETGSLPKAREVLQRVRVLDQARAVDIYLVETQLLQEHGATEQALALYETALDAHPANADLLYNRALFAVDLDRLDILERDLRQVLDNDPNHADALNALGYTLADRTDRFEEAFALISKAHKLKPDSPAILDSLGWVYYRLGNFTESLKYLRRALEITRDSEIAAHLGEVLWVTGDREQAREVWGAALREDPDSRYLRNVIDRFGQP